ncbi:MAG: transcriptional repressor [Candidatus Bathyarchaeota archaeon]|nr:transcriptional repressor [Candidatus Bathyarchaeota archaeon]
MYIHEKSLRTIIDALRKKGYKATPQRIAICKYVLQDTTHPSAKIVYQRVRKEYPTISLATVYQTLKVLKELNLIQELPFSKRETRFDPNVNPHINMVCLKCGKIVDINFPEADSLLKQISESTRFRITGQRIDIYGFCEVCGQFSISIAKNKEKML